MSDLSGFEVGMERDGMLRSSVAAYLGDVERFVEWLDGDVDVDPANLTAMEVGLYRRYLLDEGLAATTINRALSAIQHWMRWAGNDEADLVRRVRRQKQLAPKALERRELAALLRAVRKHSRHPERDLAMVQLMGQAGCRVGEVAGLRLSDLEIRERSGWARVVGRGQKERRVPLNAAARRALSEWLDVRGECDEQSVFVSQKGTPVTERTIQRVVSRAAELAGVEATPHTLRHTFATVYMDEVRDIRRLAQLLGHSDLNTTAIYLRPSDADLAQDVEELSIAG